MYSIDKRCPDCNTKLKVTRLEGKYWCDKCREFKKFKDRFGKIIETHTY